MGNDYNVFIPPFYVFFLLLRDDTSQLIQKARERERRT